MATISITSLMDMYIIRNSTLMAQRYADEILSPHVVPYDASIGNFFLLLQGNARLHTARLVENFVEA